MAEIVILGAGLTGLSAAYHLEKKGFTDYKIFEKEQTVGGLCRSVYQDGFTFDFTGHLLHISDPQFAHFIESVIGLEHFNAIKRRSFIYSHERYTRYPYQINLWSLPPHIITECIEGYVQRRHYRKQHTFYQWVMHNFGAGFGKQFFFPYQRKIFDYPVTKLSASWTGRFVPSTSLHEMLMGALQDNIDQDIGYNARFLYPKQGGIFFWIDRLYRQLAQPVYTEYTVTRVDLIHKFIEFDNGHTEPFKQLISTMPLDCLLRLIKEPSRSTLKKAADYLLCNSVINFNLGIQRDNVSDKHWIYFPETTYPFYRVGFSHNFAASMAPAGCSSLYGEVSHLNKRPSHISTLLAQSIAHAKKLFGIQEHEIATEKIIHINRAYVIYNAWRDQHVPKIIKKLEHYNVHSIGRYGAWKYASMQEGFLDGKKIADTLVILPAQRADDAITIQPAPQPRSTITT